MQYLMLGLLCLSAVCVALPPSWAGQPTFTLTITNELSAPLFNNTITLTIQGPKPFIRYLEKAVEQDPGNFNTFTATYFNSLGYFIEGFNGVLGDWANDQTYWQILNDDGPLQVGASSYYPLPGDNILFKFVQWS